MYLETIDEKAFRSFLSNPAISVLDGNSVLSPETTKLLSGIRDTVRRLAKAM